MTQRRQYARQCLGKNGYAIKDKAILEVNRSFPRDANAGVYLCPWCQMWHVGRSKKNRKQRRKVV